MNIDENIYQEVINTSPDKMLSKTEELFKEYPFDNLMLDLEEDFEEEDIDTGSSIVYITSEEKEQLAVDNMALVYYIVSKFSNTNIDSEELFSVALIGYEKALSKFNPSRNTKFSTYAYRCIQNEIFYFIRNEKKFSEKTISLNAAIATDKNGNDLEIDETIAVDETSMDDNIIRDETIECLLQVINNDLSPAERLIITRRFGIGVETMTQNELAQMVSMSQANISKKEKNILDKMRKILTSKYKIKGPI